MFWIDAICIDQQNMAERNHEVKRMGTIYKMARRGVVWLGPASNLSTRGLELLAALGRKMFFGQNMLIRVPSSTIDGHLGVFPEDIEDVLKDLDFSRKDPYGPGDYPAISDILSRQWWTRLW